MEDLRKLAETLNASMATSDEATSELVSLGLTCDIIGVGLCAAITLKEHGKFEEAELVFQKLNSRWPNVMWLSYEYIQFLRCTSRGSQADELLIQAVECGETDTNILRECLIRGLVEPPEDDVIRKRVRALLPSAINASKSPYLNLIFDYLSSFNVPDLIDSVSRSKVLELEDVKARCLDAVRDATPFCMLRLGDGEGAVLHPASRPATLELLFLQHREHFLKRWYNDPLLASDPRFLKTAEELRSRLPEADLIGMPQADWLRHEVKMRNLSSIVNCLEVRKLSNEMGLGELDRITTTTVAVDLHYRGWISDVLRESKSVSLITCHRELGNKLRMSGLARIRQIILVPAAYSDMEATGCQLYESHFHNTFPEVNRLIDCIPRGELVLIGAGFLGKLYALKIKERGGIALDIGSLVDLWMGYITRPNFVNLRQMALPPITHSDRPTSISDQREPTHVETHLRLKTECDGFAVNEKDVDITESAIVIRNDLSSNMDCTEVAEMKLAIKNTDSPIAYIEKAISYRDGNRMEIAKDILWDIIVHHPLIESGYYELAFIHRLQKEPRRAVQILNRAFCNVSSNRIHMLRAHMLYALGAREEAADALNKTSPQSSSDRETVRAIFAFGAYIKKFPLGRALFMLDRQKERSGWLGTSTLARRIGEAMQGGEPFAMVRLGDGEGSILKVSETDEAAYSALYERNRQELMQIGFGKNFDWCNNSFLSQAQSLTNVLAKCDVIGIPDESWLKHEYGISSLRGVPSLVNIYRCLKQEDNLKYKPVCSERAYLELFKDGHFEPLLKAAGRLGVITCLPKVFVRLREIVGHDNIRLYLIPTPHDRQSISGANVDSGIHYPDDFQRVQAELSIPHNCRLFLVSAGLLGKFYCETIRTNGGIALDIGSLVEVL